MLMSQDFEATAADIYLKYRFDATGVVGRNQIENSGAIDLTVAGTKRCIRVFSDGHMAQLKTAPILFVPRVPKVPYGSSPPSFGPFFPSRGSR